MRSLELLVLSWFYGYFPLGKLVSGLLPTGGEGGLHMYSPMGKRVNCMITSHWESWFLVTSRWGSWFQGYFLLGERVGCMCTHHWGKGGLYCYFPLGKLVFGFFPLGKLVSGLLPTGGEGGLHEYSPLGERVHVTSHWGNG